MIRSSPSRKSEAKLQYVKLSKNALHLLKASSGSVGYDLCSAYNYIISKRSCQVIKTDIAIKVPNGTYDRIAARSGLAKEFQIDVGGGVIDMDFRGNVCVIRFNHNDEDYIVQQGDRIAQLICEKVQYPVIEVVTQEQLGGTERGDNGFGSSGI